MHPRHPAYVVAACLAAALVFAGCSAAPAGPVAPATTPDATATAVAAPQVSASGTPTPSPAPDATPEPTAPTMSAAQEARFGPCLSKRVENWSTGECATLAQEALAEAGFLEGGTSKRIDVRTSNAILNYQRSRDIVPANGAIEEATWLALATDKPARSTQRPAECEVAGVVLCVDQGARTLTYLVDGKPERTVQVRLGGYAQHVKKKNWRNFPTANGTWKVYDKQKNPHSENYGAGAMPYSIMFYPDMYVHFSSDFAKRGYATSSHGCVNVGDKDAIVWLYENTPIGATVHIF